MSQHRNYLSIVCAQIRIATPASRTSLTTFAVHVLSPVRQRFLSRSRVFLSALKASFLSLLASPACDGGTPQRASRELCEAHLCCARLCAEFQVLTL